MKNHITRDELITQLNGILDDWPRWFEQKLERLLNSGAVELSKYPKDSYQLIKMFISAMGEEIEFQYRPVDTKERNEVKNFKHFL